MWAHAFGWQGVAGPDADADAELIEPAATRPPNLAVLLSCCRNCTRIARGP
jgi:hypothetical protein